MAAILLEDGVQYKDVDAGYSVEGYIDILYGDDVALIQMTPLEAKRLAKSILSAVSLAQKDL